MDYSDSFKQLRDEMAQTHFVAHIQILNSQPQGALLHKTMQVATLKLNIMKKRGLNTSQIAACELRVAPDGPVLADRQTLGDVQAQYAGEEILTLHFNDPRQAETDTPDNTGETSDRNQYITLFIRPAPDADEQEPEQIIITDFPATIGWRDDPGNDEIAVNLRNYPSHERISPDHAIITRMGRQLFVRKLNADDDLALNGQRVDSGEPLSDQDILRFGFIEADVVISS